MNYELALKLKNAGFTQYLDNYQGEYLDDSSGLGNEQVYLPTLSELIEACGDDFENLEKQIDNMGWTASGLTDHTHSGNEYGSTPEEAVTNLWLELNKKNAQN